MRGVLGLLALAAAVFAGWELAGIRRGAGPVGLVPESRRDPAFSRVSRELDLGGALYSYFNVSGDALKAAAMLEEGTRGLSSVSPGVAKLYRMDFREIASALGLNDITAVGFSSAAAGSGRFRNRAFFYLPGGRHGIFAVFGGPPRPVANARMAPFDADLYAESDVDAWAAYQTVRSVVGRYGGAAAADRLDRKLGLPANGLGFSLLDLLHLFTGRITLIGQFDPERNYLGYGPAIWRAPRLSLLLRFDGAGPAMEKVLSGSSALGRSEWGGRTYFRPKDNLRIDGLDLCLLVDGASFYVATSREFFIECLHRASGLDRNAEFQAMLEALGPEASNITYVTPRFFDQLRHIPGLNAAASERTRAILDAVARQLPRLHRPIMTVRENLPDGILVRNEQERSLKRELLMPALFGPAVLGLTQAMAGFAPRPAAAPNRLPPPAFPTASPEVKTDHPPTPIVQVRPAYPADLRIRGVEAVVLVEFVVEANGAVSNARALLTSDPALTAAAINSVKRWKFRPAEKDGHAVETKMIVPMTFTASNGPEARKRTAAITSWYDALERKWAAGRTFPPFSGLIWARITLDSEGRPIVGNVGHGPADPGSAELRTLLVRELGSGPYVSEVREYLAKIGYIDIAFPSIARLRTNSAPK